MREILFRGKRIDNGEWAGGNFYESQISGCYILENKLLATVGGRHSRATIRDKLIPYEVDPSTVGQYTGLKDKNGRRIFDGDELSWHNGSGAVNFDGGCFCVRLHGEIEYYGRNNPAIDVIFNLYPELEVIGNIHDNPELMEVR